MIHRRNPTRGDVDSLVTLLDALVRTRHTHLVAHWRSAGGSNGYAYRLYERLYKDVDEELNPLADLIIQLGGGVHFETVQHISDHVSRTARGAARMLPNVHLSLALRSAANETALQRTLEETLTHVTLEGARVLIEEIASTHFEHRAVLRRLVASTPT